MSELANNRVNISILGNDHQFSCPVGQEQALIDAAKQLEEHVNQVKQQTTIRSKEQALLMAALNLSHQLHEANLSLRQSNHLTEAIISKIKTNM